VAISKKASPNLLHGIKKHSFNIIKEFESYILEDLEGILTTYPFQH